MGPGVWTSPDEQQELQASGAHGPAAFGAWGKGRGAGNRGTGNRMEIWSKIQADHGAQSRNVLAVMCTVDRFLNRKDFVS